MLQLLRRIALIAICIFLTNAFCSLAKDSINEGKAGGSSEKAILVEQTQEVGISDSESQLFIDALAGLVPVVGASAWGDYDGDGDLDLVVTGMTADRRPSTIVYRNDNGVFVDVHAGIRGLWRSIVAWGDFDNDGDLDLLIAGSADSSGSTEIVTLLYRNDEGAFLNTESDLPGILGNLFAWGDYDGDGDLDLLLVGSPDGGANFLSRIYRNSGNGEFVDAGIPLPGIWGVAMAWGDYDNDGDLDLVLSGYGYGGVRTSLYENIAGVFNIAEVAIPRITNGAFAWGDFDNDGDLDLLVTGDIGYGQKISTILRNDRKRFVNIYPPFKAVSKGSIAIGDYDADGDLDIALTGETQSGALETHIYRNDNGLWTDLDVGLPGVAWGTIAWGDYDNDGDLDLILSGGTNLGVDPPFDPITRIYRNTLYSNEYQPNLPPQAPSGLTAEVFGRTVVLRWNPSSDDATPSAGLSYNLRLADAAGEHQVVSAMANAATGTRLIPAIGNANQRTSWAIENLSPGSYFWSVQALDNSYKGSAFAPEQFFTISEFARGVDSHAVALWHFDEGSGNVLYDVSPYGNHCQGFHTTWMEGKLGFGLYFNGIASYLSTPNTSSLKPTGEFTLEAWIRPDTLQFEPMDSPDEGQAVILGNLGPYPGGGGYQIQLANDGLWFEYRSSGDGTKATRRIPLQLARRFYHVAVVYQEVTIPTAMTVARMYIDGVLVDSSVFNQPIHYTESSTFYVGSNIGGRATGSFGVREFPGIIDEVRISNVARRPEEFLITSIKETPQGIPREFILSQNYPNPFNPSTKIEYWLPVRSNVLLMVFDVLGREIARLVDGVREAGYHSERWIPNSISGGMYFYRMEAVSIAGDQLDRFVEARKLIYVK